MKTAAAGIKTEPGLRAVPSLRWLAALVVTVAAGVHFLAASETDYLPDDGELAPSRYHLDARGERQADAMAYFVTGVLQEESEGPEKALASYRKVLELDPGYTKLGIEIAYDCLRRGEATEAIGVLKDAIKAKPDDPDPALALSNIYLQHLNKPDLATRYAEAALKADPGRFAAYKALWEISQYQGDAAASAKVVDRAFRSKTGNPWFWLQLAQFIANSKQGDAFADPRIATRLSTCLDNAARGAAADPDVLVRIADFYMLYRQFGPAADFYKKTADINAALPDLDEKFAEALTEAGRGNEAIPVFERIIKANPLSLRAYDQLYKLYDDRGNYEKALRTVEQALIINRTNVVRHADMLVLLLRTGRVNAAIERAAEARKLFPRVPFFTYTQARAFAIARRNDDAMRAFESALAEATAANPAMLDSGFYIDYASVAEQAGRYAKAAELLRKAIALDPKNPDPYNSLGYMLAEQKQDLDEAEQLIRKALSIVPDNGAYMDSLGWVFYQQGKYDDALAELLGAAKALPKPDSVVYEHIGDAYRALNRTAEAVLYWQKSAQLDPTNKALLGKIDDSTGKVAQKPE